MRDKTTYSPEEVAEILGGCAATYRAMARKGTLKLPHFQCGNRLRFPKKFIDELAGAAYESDTIRRNQKQSECN